MAEALTEQEKEALRTSGSWPNVGADIFAAVERILNDRAAAVRDHALQQSSGCSESLCILPEHDDSTVHRAADGGDGGEAR